MAPYRSVRSLARGLSMIRVFNEIGSVSIQDLATACKLHRTTVYRLVDTLKSLGYVEENESDHTLRLTNLVRTLSSGFVDHDWLREAAYPILVELSATLPWPINLLTPFADTMIVTETTHHLSPFSIHRGLVGTRWPYMNTAYGRAFLAFCTEPERRELLALLRRSSIPANALANDPKYVLATIRATRRQGYGSAVSEVVRENSSIAVPISLKDRTIGCVNIIFFTTAMTPQEAAAKYLPGLRRAAAQIAAAAANAYATARPASREPARGIDAGPTTQRKLHTVQPTRGVAPFALPNVSAKPKKTRKRLKNDPLKTRPSRR